MSVTYAIRFDVVPTQRERFVTLLDGVLDAMRNEPMFYAAILHRDPENPNRFLLVETWESHADVLAVQLARPYRKAYHDALPQMRATARDVTIWEQIRADSGARRAATPPLPLPEQVCALG